MNVRPLLVPLALVGVAGIVGLFAAALGLGLDMARKEYQAQIYRGGFKTMGSQGRKG